MTNSAAQALHLIPGPRRAGAVVLIATASVNAAASPSAITHRSVSFCATPTPRLALARAPTTCRLPAHSLQHRQPISTNIEHPAQPEDYPTSSEMASAATFYDFKPLDKRGQEVSLADYKGKVVLVVNTASKCGFTPQYAGLEKLYKDVRAKHGDDFVILGFPCNQFGAQEPGTDDDIQSFCQVNYGVTFPIMQKTDVNGDDANPLWRWLKDEKPGLMGLKRIKWNFEKFLVGKDGQVKGRWASTTKPESLEQPVLEELKRK